MDDNLYRLVGLVGKNNVMVGKKSGTYEVFGNIINQVRNRNKTDF